MNEDVENATTELSAGMSTVFGLRLQYYNTDHGRITFTLLPDKINRKPVQVEILIDDDPDMVNRYREVRGRKAAATRRKNQNKK